jgi:hypothetical protein
MVGTHPSPTPLLRRPAFEAAAPLPSRTGADASPPGFFATVLPANKVDRQVFVAYPFKLYASPDYRKVYERVEKSFGIQFVFADMKVSDLHILQKIANMILESRFSIFDISGWNPNVTLELGLAYGFREKAFIAFDPSKTPLDDVPADIRGIDRLQYANLTELEEKLSKLSAQEFPPPAIPDAIGPAKNRIRSVLDQAPGLTAAEIARSIGVPIGYARFVIADMMTAGELGSTGQTRGTRYRLSEAGAQSST